MKTTILTTAATLFAVSVLSNFAVAQVSQLQPAVTQQTQVQEGGQFQQGVAQAAVVGQPQTRVSPVIGSPMPNKYYFGMQLQLVRGYGGSTLRVVSVTPGSPAQYAGLEYGDEIRTVNGQGFHYARDSFDAVAMMNRYVDAYYGGGPAPAVAASGVAASYYPPMPSPSPRANLVVRNVRNGQDVHVTVRPQRKSRGGSAPAQVAVPFSATGG